MKLSLTVEASAINVLALNMGRIAVNIDGIELAALIDVVCDNGYSLRVADEPGKLIVEDPLPRAARLNGIQCSTAHITCEDNAILDLLTLQRHDGGDWILYTGYGFILRLNARLHPVLELKRLGYQKPVVVWSLRLCVVIPPTLSILMLQVKCCLALPPLTGSLIPLLPQGFYMPELSTEAALNILIDWLQDNIDCGNKIVFGNDEDGTDSAALLPWIEKALQEVRDLRHLQLLQQARID